MVAEHRTTIGPRPSRLAQLAREDPPAAISTLTFPRSGSWQWRSSQVEANRNRILGINSVEWASTRVGIDGWSAVQPDGNLFTGTAGFAALDADLWTLVSLELVRQEPS